MYLFLIIITIFAVIMCFAVPIYISAARREKKSLEMHEKKMELFHKIDRNRIERKNRRD